MSYPHVVVEPPDHTRYDLTSHNWCDKTTWYTESVQVLGEVLTDTGDGLTFAPAVERPWVDVTHRKITQEHRIREIYRPVILVDDVEVDEALWTGTSPNDYTIDYNTGRVTFNSVQTGVVKADRYNYVAGSGFYITAPSGYILRTNEAELQFSTNADMLDCVIFCPGVFTPAPVLETDPNKITRYETIYDLVNESVGVLPEMPQLGGAGVRGMDGPMHTFQWPWSKRGAYNLAYSAGEFIKVYLESGVEFGGDRAYATFYTTLIREG